MKIRYLMYGFLMTVGTAQAAGGGELEHADINVHDRAALQRGATVFVNYCMGCHSAQHQRYQRIGDDLELSEDQVEEFLVPDTGEASDYMLTAMDAEEAEDWFGISPPDLTLVARSRGTDWVYSFLKGFYLTDDGWNNTVLEHTSMPHVLWELQGIQRAVTETHTDEAGETRTEMVGLELDREGRMNAEEYDDLVLDLVTFMEYLAEPAILKREKMGIWVLLFLGFFTLLSYLLYKEYWKDVK